MAPMLRRVPLEAVAEGWPSLAITLYHGEMTSRDPMVERIASAQRVARARAERLRTTVPELARALRARGARRVRLFGYAVASIATPWRCTFEPL